MVISAKTQSNSKYISTVQLAQKINIIKQNLVKAKTIYEQCFTDKHMFVGFVISQLHTLRFIIPKANMHVKKSL